MLLVCMLLADHLVLDNHLAPSSPEALFLPLSAFFSRLKVFVFKAPGLAFFHFSLSVGVILV